MNNIAKTLLIIGAVLTGTAATGAAVIGVSRAAKAIEKESYKEIAEQEDEYQESRTYTLTFKYAAIGLDIMTHGQELLPTYVRINNDFETFEENDVDFGSYPHLDVVVENVKKAFFYTPEYSDQLGNRIGVSLKIIDSDNPDGKSFYNLPYHYEYTAKSDAIITVYYRYVGGTFIPETTPPDIPTPQDPTIP